VVLIMMKSVPKRSLFIKQCTVGAIKIAIFMWKFFASIMKCPEELRLLGNSETFYFKKYDISLSKIVECNVFNDSLHCVCFKA
jgi:hypothetical protein